MLIRTTVSTVAICAALAAVPLARAAESPREIDFEIEAQPVTSALQRFAEQSGYQLAFLADSASNVRANRLSGRFSPDEAIDLLLEGTGLRFHVIDDRTIAILQRGAEEDESSNSRPAVRFASSVFRPAVVAQAQAAAQPAQTGPALQTEEDATLEVEEIVVTGSRIARSELKAVSPVVSLGELAFDQRGITKVEDELNSLPQVIGSQNSGQSHGSSGTATVDLRGLGDERTLVLKDGKRLPFGSPQSVGVDIDQIPSQLIERVELLTGGASAVYGADAVAGVVNFVMKDDFEGLEVDFQGGFHQTANDSSLIRPLLREVNRPAPGNALDGTTLDLTVLMGTNFADDRGNVTMWFTYANDNEISEGDRTTSVCPLGALSDTELTCIGATGNTLPGRFSDFGVNAETGGTSFDLTLDPQGTDGVDADADGITGLRRFDAVLDTINFNQFGVFQRPRERFTFGASGHYDIAENHEFFLDFSFLDNSTHRTIAPSASFFETDNINCDNPLLSVDQVATFCAEGNTFVDEMGVERGRVSIGRGNLEGRPRFEKTDIQTFRVVGGFRGKFLDNFEYELFGQFGKTDFSEFDEDLNLERIGQAIDVIEDPVTGEIRCRDTSGGCVPWDIFSLDVSSSSDFKGVRPLPFTTNVSQEAIDFILLPVQTQGETKQTVFGGNVSGDLTPYGIQSPFANSGVQAVLGFEYRRDQLENVPDFAGQIPLAAGFGGPIDPVAGKVTVYDLFGEIQAPLIEDAFLIEELTANAAYRFSDYTVTTGTGNTYTVGLSWQIMPDIRGRGQFARAVRAPNPVELFSPQSVGLFSLTRGSNGLFEPCAGDFDPNTPIPEPQRSFEECARTGVTAAQFGNLQDNPAGQFNELQGGNPDLDPEKANTWTAGVIITPRFAPGLTLTVDWYSIKVKRAISNIDPGLILNGCLDSGEPVFCDLINRGGGGRLFFQDDAFIVSTNLNTGVIQTKGVDADLNYDFNLEDAGLANAGSLNFRFIGTWLDKFVNRPLPKAAEAALQGVLPPESLKFDCTGFFGSNQCNRPRPEFRWRVTTTWRTPWEIDVTTTWRYTDSVTLFGGGPAVSSKLSSTSFVDLSFNYQIMDNVTLRMGVNNIADKDPPVSSEAGIGFAEGNTFPGTFDVKGRFFFGGVAVSF